MKIGDLVKFKVPDFAKGQVQHDGRMAGEGRPTGLVLSIRTGPGHGVQVGWCDVMWTEATGVLQTTESWENLEVVNETR